MRTAIPCVSLPVQASFDPGGRIGRVVRSGPHWIVTMYESRESFLLDELLGEVRRYDMGTCADRYVLPTVASSALGELFVICQRDRVCVFDSDGQLAYEWAHDPWNKFTNGAAAFTADGERVWIVFPTSSGSSELVLVRIGTWKVLARTQLDSYWGAHEIYPQPGTARIVVESAEGQDGPRTWIAEERAGAIVTTPLDAECDRVFGSLDPEGREFVSVSHHRGDGLTIHEFPSGRVLATLQEAAVEAGSREFGFSSGFLSHARVLAETREMRLLLLERAALLPIAEVLPEGYSVRGYDEHGKPTTVEDEIVDYESDVSGWYVASANQLLTVHRQRVLHLSRIPPLAKSGTTEAHD